MTTNYHTAPSVLSPLLLPRPDLKQNRQQQQQQHDEKTKKSLFQNAFTRSSPSQSRRNGENKASGPSPVPGTTTPPPSQQESNHSPRTADRVGNRASPLRAPGDSLFSPTLPPRAESLSDFASASTLSRRLTATAKRTMTVRALFDYEPGLETAPPTRGLAFSHGDILLVTNANDPVWWQARRLVCPHQPMTIYQRRQQFLNSSATTTTDFAPPNTGSSLSVPQPGPLGLIPSRQRVERRHRTRMRHVNFFNKVTVINGQSVTTTTASADIPPMSPAAAAVHAQPPDAFGRPSRSRNPSLDANMVGGDTDSGGSATPSPLTDSALNGHFPATSGSMLDRRTGSRSGGDAVFGSRSGSLPRTLLKRLSAWGRKKDDSLPRSHAGVSANSVETVCASGEELNNNIRSYEVVVPLTISLPRPLLIFGPLKETIILALLRDPRFSPCIPHTSRPPRPDERDGFDYHFMPSREAMEAEVNSDEFIEVGQFQEHLYATSLQAVLQILRSGRICILDLSLAAVQRLEQAGLHPMSVLVKPRSVVSLRVMQRRLTEEQARRTLEFANQLEADNWRTFTGIITYDTIENAVKAIQDFTVIHGGPVIWVNAADAQSAGSLNSHFPSSYGSQSSCLPRSPQKNRSNVHCDRAN